jgi:hypothetical protein
MLWVSGRKRRGRERDRDTVEQAEYTGKLLRTLFGRLLPTLRVSGRERRGSVRERAMVIERESDGGLESQRERAIEITRLVTGRLLPTVSSRLVTKLSFR